MIKSGSRLGADTWLRIIVAIGELERLAGSAPKS
jgi:hypothetical protein